MGREIRIAGARVAAVDAELKVLVEHVALPLVFGRETAVAAVVGEGADEGAGFGGFVVVAGAAAGDVFGFGFD
jgi:hypothetical protein